MNDVTSEQDRLETELRQTRSRMDDRLTELRDRMTPGQILDDVTGYLRGGQGAEFANNLMATLRTNPVPAALTGIGLIWLMASGTRAPAELVPNAERPVPYPRYASDPDAGKPEEDLTSRLGRAEQGVVRWAAETEDSFRDRLDEARGKMLGVARQAGETSEAFGARIQEAIAATKQKVVETVHDLRDQVATATDQVAGATRRVADNLAESSDTARAAVSGLLRSFGDNPVLLAALGFAGGALLGALIPQSEAETAAFGDIARQAREAASNLAQQAVDTGGEAAKKAIDAGLEAARAHGLSGDSSVKDVIHTVASGEIIEAAGDVAEHALQAGADVVSESALRPSRE